MKLLRSLILLVAALAARPALAVPTQPPAQEAEVSPTAIDAEMRRYGEWMARVMALQSPVQTQLSALGPAWQAARAEGGTSRQLVESIRPTVARTLAVIDTAISELNALEKPRFAALDLPAEVRPAAIVEELLGLNRQLRTTIDAFNPMLDAALNNDLAAVEATGIRVLASLRLVLESQVVITRASQAATPRDDPAWALGNFELIFYRSGARLFAAWHPFEPPRVDDSLPADMIALAGELEVNAEQGAQRLDAELESYAGELADAQERGDASAAAVLSRGIAAFTITRGYFPLSRELAAILRAEAASMRGRPTTQESTVRFFNRLRPIRERMEEIGRQTVARMAEPQ
jgi:hypothetical protein